MAGTRPKPDAPGVEILPVAAHRCRLTLEIDGTDGKGRKIAYVVTAGPLGLACTCKSVVYRSGPAAYGPDPICKHSRALAALGLLP